VKRVNTRENVTAANRPSLLIQYEVPEPASAALLAAGVFMLFRRTRQ